ncbi:chromosome segregation protein SMC [Caldiplasma sukawensis]
MIIESLYIKNFKSFSPHGTKIDFKPGVTMIAGPNGSGKSNIGDALLFVLGGRSSKTVRVDRLEELIHNTGKKNDNEDLLKKGLKNGNAEVAVTFVEEGDDGEVIRTELKRTIEVNNYEAKSSYFINGNRVKRSDVDEFLVSNGINEDSYSFVLQGDVNHFMTMSGTERRKLLESIGGIETYNVKLEKAKIERENTLNNVSTMNTLRGEIEKDLEKFKIEAEKLRTYKKLIDRKRDLIQTKLSKELRENTIDENNTSQALQDNERRIGELESKISNLQKRIDEIKGEIKKINNEKMGEVGNRLNELIKIRDELKIGISRITISSENSLSQIKNNENEIEEFSQKIEEIENKLLEYNANYNEKIIRKGKLESGIKTMSAEIDKIIGLSNENEKKNRKNLEEMDRIEKEIKEIEKETEITRSERSEKEGKKKEIEGKISQLEEEVYNLKLEINEINYKMNSSEKEKKLIEEEVKKTSDQFYSVKNEIEKLTNERDDLRKRITNLKDEISNIKIKMGSQSGMFKAISSLMEEKAKGRITGIISTVSELISFDPKLEKAVYSSAGGRIYSIVVENEDTGQECIEFLRRNKMGRLTFLPLNKLVGGKPRSPTILLIQSGKTMNLISKNISYDSKYENIIWYAFQDTVLMDSIENAKNAPRGARIVTLDGDIIDSSGAMTGGYYEVGQRNQFSGNVLKKESDLAIYTQQEQSLNERIKILSKEKEELEHTLISKNKTSSIRPPEEYRKEMEEKNLKRIEKENLIKKLQAERDSIEREIEEFKREESENINTIAKLEEKKKEMITEMGNTKTEKINLKEMQNELQIKNDEIKKISEEITEISTNIKRYSERKEEIYKEIDKIKKKNVELRNLISKNDLESSNKKLELTGIEEEIENLQEKNREIVSKTKELEKEQQKYEMEVQNLEREIKVLNSKNMSLGVSLGSLREKIKLLRKDMESNGGNVLNDIISKEEIKVEIQSCDNEIVKLGDINEGAEKLYNDKAQEYEEISDKLRRLENEIRNVEQLMAELEEKKKNILVELFKNINREFSAVFRRVSDGGEALLQMSDENDPLNSEINVLAIPKKNDTFKKLSVLSGGEKSLVSLSFIIAVQKIKPSPFYFLDEIDAFFDGSNAEKMGRLLQENRDRAQILFVCLKSFVGSFADNMIGVTMDRETMSTRIFTRVMERSINAA